MKLFLNGSAVIHGFFPNKELVEMAARQILEVFTANTQPSKRAKR